LTVFTTGLGRFPGASLPQSTRSLLSARPRRVSARLSILNGLKTEKGWKPHHGSETF